MASKRIELRVTMQGIYSYKAPAYGYGYETRYIYKMVDDNGNVYVWKTTSFLVVHVPYTGKKGNHNYEDKNGNPYDIKKVNKGDILNIKATVKGESEYNGEKQTEVNRVTIVSREFAAETYEEMMERKARERAERVKAQYDSIKEGDFIWQMPYRQYKEHYSDCETIEGSYNQPESYRRRSVPTIKVIIRDGRLKASGTRGQHYSGYEIKYRDGGQNCIITYRAISEDTALKRFEKDFPDAEFIGFGKIYNYGR